MIIADLQREWRVDVLWFILKNGVLKELPESVAWIENKTKFKAVIMHPKLFQERTEEKEREQPATGDTEK